MYSYCHTRILCFDLFPQRTFKFMAVRGMAWFRICSYSTWRRTTSISMLVFLCVSPPSREQCRSQNPYELWHSLAYLYYLDLQKLQCRSTRLVIVSKTSTFAHSKKVSYPFVFFVLHSLVELSKDESTSTSLLSLSTKPLP